MKGPRHTYVASIAKFFRVPWLHATIWLTDEEIEELEKEIGWRRP